MQSPTRITFTAAAALCAALAAVSAATARSGGRNRHTEIGLANATAGPDGS